MEQNHNNEESKRNPTECNEGADQPLLGEVAHEVNCRTCDYNIFPESSSMCSGSLCTDYSSYKKANRILTDNEREENIKNLFSCFSETVDEVFNNNA